MGLGDMEGSSEDLTFGQSLNEEREWPTSALGRSDPGRGQTVKPCGPPRLAELHGLGWGLCHPAGGVQDLPESAGKPLQVTEKGCGLACASDGQGDC